MAQHRSAAGELAPALAHHAEAVCRHYLSAGRRCGHYWTVGDVANSPGRSLYVRLTGPVSGKGAGAGGVMLRQVNMAIYSTLLPSHRGSARCAMPWTRPGRSWPSPVLSPSQSAMPAKSRAVERPSRRRVDSSDQGNRFGVPPPSVTSRTTASASPMLTRALCASIRVSTIARRPRARGRRVRPCWRRSPTGAA